MSEDRLHLDRSAWRWPRLLVIATAAVILASCRSITQPLMLPLAAVAVAPEESAEATREPSTAVVQASAVVQAGCEAPCPPLPRRLPLARGHLSRHDGRCEDGNACQSCNQTDCLHAAGQAGADGRPVPRL
jgi:hypothetical protein